MIRLIIFDAGGVLYAWDQKIVNKAVRRFLLKHGVNDFAKSNKIWSRIEESLSVGKISLREGQEKWLEAIGLHESLLDEWVEVDEKEIWGRFRKTPGVNRLLTKLKSNYILAVLSDTIDSKSERIKKLEIVGVDHKVFDEIFTSHDLGICKPHRMAFYMVLERFCVKPREAIFVSDDLDELRGAKRIGLTTVGFNCKGGDYHIKKLNEIKTALQDSK